MVKLIEDKQNLSKENMKLVAENLDLKNELLILKLQINEDENENENEDVSGNEKYLMNIKSKIVKELEKKLENIKIEYEETLEELKRKENDKVLNKEDKDENSELNIEIDELKKDIEDKKIKIEQLENEIKSTKNTEVTKMLNKYLLENYKNNNNQALNENNSLEEQIKMMINEPPKIIKDEKTSSIDDNIKEENNDNPIPIEKISKDNNIQNQNNINNYTEEDIKEIIIDNTKDNKENPIFKSYNSNEIKDNEKIKLFKNQIRDLKEMNESDIIQIKTLKEEIRELKEKLKKMETFSGQVKSFDEFITLLRNALLNYKPKKKEQKDALKKLIEIVNNHHI